MNDTIAGISTTLGVGAISIVRVSGNDSIKIVNSIFKGKNLENALSHTINYGHIVDKDEVIDEVLVSIMKAPRTFTREDIVEINCHGGIATTNKVLELLLLNGARLAEAGEFTKRAFLNGRIDLIEAESIMDVINAKTDKARKLSINQLEGRVSTIIRNFRQELLELLASIEVNIDYPEYEDIAIMTVDNISSEMKNIREKLEKIVNESENGKIIRDGIKTVIVGRPNVGKSSILNKLLDYDKAIVTDIAGTTRDIVEGEINLDGILLKLVDTAGIRETDDIVEKIGVNRSLEELENADLIIVVINNNEELNDYDQELLNKVKDKNSIIVINKCDLDRKIDINLIENNNIVEINTVDFDKIDILKDKIKELFNLDMIEQSDYTYLSNIRQISLAKECLSILSEVESAIDREDPVDLIEIDIKRIWTKLGEIIGDTYSDELIDQLFSQFCLGK
ncbi:MAG: tRNA uridine-5-carboxymethylaminomethyl(34) synthesis GTPase MnmE [Bacilli bacterium]|nr:tRNA uridine-5-carboxymethylaminomethyl(34) synthesis GTPase MnmE [Bacilli bacterium]MBQ7105882.1 tRNA uridine-5-carboxymethylaminomethyl(34) synthesis GTPase MnmE [Bacilli bacterium]